MESVLQKFKRKSSRLSFFCRKSRQTAAVIELPVKDVEKDLHDAAVVVSRPPPDVRLVLFRECGETSDRKLLFDSKSFEQEKVEQMENRNYANQGLINNNSKAPNCCRISSNYQYVRGPQDSGILSEMLFGSVGMASRASSLKAHIIKEPSQLMLSRVFCVESVKDTTVSLDRGMEHHLPGGRLNPVLSRRKAKTLPVPTPEPPHIPPPTPPSLASSLTSRITRSDSSSSLMSLTSILGASLSTTGSLGSWSIPQSIPTNLRAHSLPPASRQSSRDSFTLNHEPHNGTASRKTKVKIGFAVIFKAEPSTSSEFQQFFFEHFPLIESHVTLLKEQVEKALNTCKSTRTTEFVTAMMEALHLLTVRVSALYSTPRLPKPVWSSLTTATSSKAPWLGDHITVECFIADLTRMTAQHNTKNKSFFMSGLITAVLTNHLAWVNTMMPSSGEEKFPPIAYNPLWAQLGDLYGAVGSPTKVAKTVVVGEIHELVSTIISILSYFIRCSHIKRVVQVPDEITPQTFLNEEKLEMTSVPCELETDYILVSRTDNDHPTMTKSLDHEIPTATQVAQPNQTPEMTSFCSKKGELGQQTESKDIPQPPVTQGSTLCRSRSSPAASMKPLMKVNRQKSSGNTDNLPTMRLRTNSNDMFARPRGVQSRRTSHDVSRARLMSRSSSALVIPDTNTTTVSSLEGSKSLCMDAHPNVEVDNFRKRFMNDGGGSCPSETLRSGDSETLKPPLPKRKPAQLPNIKSSTPTRVKTHKRVSSEPFDVTRLPVVSSDQSLMKTNSIYFDTQNVVRRTFVDRFEPKVVTVTHVQRAQPQLVTGSPGLSPHLPRSSPGGSKGPIYGFNTSSPDVTPKPRSKHLSGSCLTEIQRVNKNPWEVIPSKSSEEIEGSISPRPRRSSSNASSSGVRRTSSSNSGKIKIATRRRRLTTDSQNSIDNEETVKELPPLGRIPSVSLKHDDFDEYFEDNDEYIFFGTEDSAQSENFSEKISDNHSSETSTHSSVSESHPTVKESSQKSENLSSATKPKPPPLPSTGPCHRSTSEKLLDKPRTNVPKSKSSVTLTSTPPPLPKSPPIHRGSLYPKLDEKKPPLPQKPPKSSLYPSLLGCEKSPYNKNCENTETPKQAPQIYPSLGTDPPRLYPRLPNPSTQDSLEAAVKEDEQSEHTPAVDSAENTDSYFASGENIPLAPVELSEKEKEDGKESEALDFSQLLADYSPDYLWGFALHGTRNQPCLVHDIVHELQHSIRRPVLDEPVAEAVSIVADTDKWTVQVLSSHRIKSDRMALPAMSSKLITNILERITKLYQMKTPASFCLEQLENELGQLVLKSRMLARYVVGNTRVTMSQLSAVLGIESSDLPLLMAIASCHNPQVAATLL